MGTSRETGRSAEPVIGDITFFPATAAAVLLCGLGSGLLVMLLGGVVGHYVFMPPFRSFKFAPEQASTLTVFYVAAALICLILNQMTGRGRWRCPP